MPRELSRYPRRPLGWQHGSCRWWPLARSTGGSRGRGKWRVVQDSSRLLLNRSLRQLIGRQITMIEKGGYVRDILAKPVGTRVEAYGWVKTRRDSKGVHFLQLNDGSGFKDLQVVIEAGQIP